MIQDQHSPLGSLAMLCRYLCSSVPVRDPKVNEMSPCRWGPCQMVLVEANKEYYRCIDLLWLLRLTPTMSLRAIESRPYVPLPRWKFHPCSGDRYPDYGVQTTLYPFRSLCTLPGFVEAVVLPRIASPTKASTPAGVLWV
jgi:hypothetical protein